MLSKILVSMAISSLHWSCQSESVAALMQPCAVSRADDNCDAAAALLLPPSSSYAFKLVSHNAVQSFNTFFVSSGVFVHKF